MNKLKIGIIGGGATGSALLCRLIEDSIKMNVNIHELIIFEKSGVLGKGLAYSDDVSSNLLNRTADTMSIKNGDQGEFIDWLFERKNSLEHYFDTYNITRTNDCFVPRSLFGEYVVDSVMKSVELASRNFVKITIVPDEAVNITHKNNGYEIETAKMGKYIVKSAVLTVGHLESKKYADLCGIDNYFNSPYPIKNLVSTIPKKSTVAILGSRLSAIDTALGFTSNGFEGNIIFASRNGYLPAIRSETKSYKLKRITKQRIDNITKNGQVELSLMDVEKLLMEELFFMTGEIVNLRSWFSRTLNPIQYFKNELVEIHSSSRIAIQSLFIEMNQIIGLIWHHLSLQAKHGFFQTYRSKWISYRVGIPENNAIKIMELFETGQLSFIQNFSGVNHDPEKNMFTLKDQNNNSYFTNYLVNATGSEDSINNCDNPLIRNLKNTGLIQPHEFGGININFDTSEVINTSQRIQPGLYAIGNLTSGTYFFTSVLEVNVAHAENVSNRILTNEIVAQAFSKQTAST